MKKIFRKHSSAAALTFCILPVITCGTAIQQAQNFKPNQAPVIDTVTVTDSVGTIITPATALNLIPNTVFVIRIEAHDPEGQHLTYSVSSATASQQSGATDSSGYTAQFITNSTVTALVPVNVQITVSDKKGASASLTAEVGKGKVGATVTLNSTTSKLFFANGDMNVSITSSTGGFCQIVNGDGLASPPAAVSSAYSFSSCSAGTSTTLTVSGPLSPSSGIIRLPASISPTMIESHNLWIVFTDNVNPVITIPLTVTLMTADFGISSVIPNVVTTFAGTGSSGFVNGTGTGASFNNPQGIATDGTNLFIADSGNNVIRKIVISSGAVTTFAGSGAGTSADGTGTAASFNYPVGIAVFGENIYVADTGSSKIRKIEISTKNVTTLAGSGTAAFADGTGSGASFNSPQGITTDGTYVYVADMTNYRIRKIEISTGIVTTLAGSGTNTSTDGTGVEATFSQPRGITTDGTNLYVAEASFSKIRKIVIETGAVTSIAGSGSSGSADGTGTAATFNGPFSLTSDGTHLYIADTSNYRIRRLTISSVFVYTLAGSGSSGSANGTGSSASFNSSCAITTDGKRLFVADRNSHLIRKLSAP